MTYIFGFIYKKQYIHLVYLDNKNLTFTKQVINIFNGDRYDKLKLTRLLI